jgi:putative intracellular protease/amidase
MMKGQPKHAYLFAFDGMADWEYGYIAAELNTGRYFAERGTRLELQTVSLSPEPVRTMGGLRILSDMLLEEIKAEGCAMLILPGGEGWLGPERAPAIEKTRSFLNAGIPVAAICGATIALAAAGLLDDRAHTSNDLGYLKAVCPAYRGEALYKTDAAVMDRDLITASGVAPLEFARLILECLGLSSPKTLDAWLGINQSHEPEYYYSLMKSIAD